MNTIFPGLVAITCVYPCGAALGIDELGLRRERKRRNESENDQKYGFHGSDYKELKVLAFQFANVKIVNRQFTLYSSFRHSFVIFSTLLLNAALAILSPHS